MRFALTSLIFAAGLAGAAYAQDPAAPTQVSEPPPPAPTLPTSGPGAEVITALEKVCVASVRGQKLEVVAKANGYKFSRRDETWTKALGGVSKDHKLIVYPQYSDKAVCTIEVRYGMGDDVEVAKALNVWAFVQDPPLDPTANYTQPQDPDGKKRVRRSWEHLTQHKSTGLNFSTVRNPDDTPVSPKYDMGTMSYQERAIP